MHLQGFEPGTHWLRVSCSTNWAKGALKESCSTKKRKRKERTEMNTELKQIIIYSIHIWDKHIKKTVIENWTKETQKQTRSREPRKVVQALGLLVSVSSMHYCTYTSDLSNLSSTSDLTSLCCGISNLEVCFTLRCLQRLSHPYAATQLCSWRNNWCTRGMSIPVLSY